MRYKIDHDYHIHSKISLCSNDPEQTNERILKYATENGIKKMCLTDHFWDESVPVDDITDFYSIQNYGHISKALPLPQSDNTEFLFGCETDYDKNGVLGVSGECFDKFAFVVIPTTHLHMMGFTLTERDSASEKRAELWVKRLDSLLSLDLTFHKIGIAHLACPLIAPTREEYLKTLSLIPEDEMHRVFARAAALGVGIEINSFDMKFADCEADTVLRMFKIAKEEGCKFYLGSDAHHPKDLNCAIEYFDRAIDLLGLTENDKFHIEKL